MHPMHDNKLAAKGCVADHATRGRSKRDWAAAQQAERRVLNDALLAMLIMDAESP